MTRNIKIVLEYDGTRYHGWQRQVNKVTVQEILEKAISDITQEDVRVIGSGRTDAGVHAIGQVANFKTNSDIDVRGLHRGINSLLPWDIVVNELKEADASFHARYDAKSKIYVYQISCGPVRPALGRNYAWFMHEPLDIGMMEEAARTLLGTFDFSSFCGSNCGIKNHVRTVMAVDIIKDERNIVKFSIEADGFLKHMVRNVIGTLADISKGRIPVARLADIVAAKDRRKAGQTAPAHGLFLKEVKY
ncbi:MAG TPA: tRNA pseudouridine(38-40) synthase TruA [Syntrophales bacterium]|nr:tRNA pseudouridine(38-40) synthase TruA [Syntrophales bacterium]